MTYFCRVGPTVHSFHNLPQSWQQLAIDHSKCEPVGLSQAPVMANMEHSLEKGKQLSVRVITKGLCQVGVHS